MIYVTREKKRMMTLVVVLFFSFILHGYSQCIQSFSVDKSADIKGIENGNIYYYRNLIIQDLALATQKAFNDIIIPLDYKVRYSLNTCGNNGIDIQVRPLELACRQVKYLQYNVSSSIIPEKADLVFHLVNRHGMVFDSLIFYNIPVNADTGLYTTLSTGDVGQAESFSVKFAGSRFHFTKASYERFRDLILKIDNYYAAVLLADSALFWAGQGFLSENAPVLQLHLRQLELERIISYVNPNNFNDLLSQQTGDAAGLGLKYAMLRKAAVRLKAIKGYVKPAKTISNGMESEIWLFIGWLEYYNQFAAKADFHYMNFLGGLATPQFSAGRVNHVYHQFANYFQMSPGQGQNVAYNLAFGFLKMGSSNESSGDYMRALNYYRLAKGLSRQVYLPGVITYASEAMSRMEDSLAFAFLNISARSALAMNPVMATEYLYKAREIYEKSGSGDLPQHLKQHQSWLYADFENQAQRLIDAKNYKKALAYLLEIQNFCQQENEFPCPDDFYLWMKTCRQGLYMEILLRSKSLADRDEYSEASEYYRQAVAMRLGSGYAIEKDKIETNLELRFRQARFEELYEEGLRFNRLADYNTALYYFNKADNLARLGLLSVQPELMDYRLSAARQVILQNLSEGRVKAWANDFEGARYICERLEDLIREYQLPDNDSLVDRFETLKSDMLRKKCIKLQEEYDGLIAVMNEAAGAGDYIRAYDLANEAINLSMDNLDCSIQDSEAWYQKVVLETPAGYQKQERALEMLAYKSDVVYREGFAELRKFYQKHKLLNQGITFTPLIDRVLKFNDTVFLSGMMKYFIKSRNIDHAFRVLKKLHDLGVDPGSVAVEQRAIAYYYAEQDAVTPSELKPWEQLRDYIGKDRWYKDFRSSYRKTYLKAVNWKFSDWPFLWKK